MFFREPLDTVATFWRIFRTDGVTLGFTSHDRALWFAGILHRAAPGMVPSAIRRSADLGSDSAEVSGALSHDSIRSDDLRAGRYDNAAIQIGAVDWITREYQTLFHGTLGIIAEEGRSFTAELRSAKAVLQRDTIPRTSPTCRAKFCGPGCNLSGTAFTREGAVTAIDRAAYAVRFDMPTGTGFIGGELRWADGPGAGLHCGIVDHDDGALVFDARLPDDLVVGTRATLREGCDHTLATCHARFGNAVNFQGEPFLPGNDLLARYPLPQ